jgi:hypothetical protein
MSIAWAVFDGFTRPIEPRSTSWNGVIEWTAAIERLLGGERSALGRRRASSDRLLHDLECDPSARDWTSFLPLRREREEDWSDWLAQLLDESTTGNVNIRRKIRRPQVVEKIGSPHSTISATGSSVRRPEP